VTTRLVALLRGINVGRAKRVSMADLRGLLTDLGYTEVATYLQSGNAVFSCTASAAGTAAANIEAGLTRTLGVSSTVIVRTAAELNRAVGQAPLLDRMTDPSRYLVGFLGGDSDPEGVRSLDALDVAPNHIRVIGRELYLWCPDGVLASPFGTTRWDRVLGVPVTMRNWKTVTRLVALSTV
jgi:uncharacterized protein (DUF1697 family)